MMMMVIMMIPDQFRSSSGRVATVVWVEIWAGVGVGQIEE
jgi:hypothetical protein